MTDPTTRIRERLKVGQKLRWRRDTDVTHEIVAVRPTGYDWCYPDMPDKVFCSEDSTDPLYERRSEWEVLCEED